MNLPFFIARRYLLHQKGTFSSFIIKLAIVATALSVGTMVVSLAFVNGFKYTIREKLFTFWGHMHVTPYNVNPTTIITPEPVYLNPQMERAIAGEPHVVQIAPYVLRPVIMQANKTMEGLQLKGIDEDYRWNDAIKFTGDKINFSDSDYAQQIILSRTTANRLQVKEGDDILLYFLEQGATFPRMRKVTIAGFFHTGMEELDKDFAICDIRMLQRINNWQPNQVNGYQIELDNEQYADELSNDIYNKYVEPPLTVNTIKDIYSNIFDWLSLQDTNAAIIIIIMIIVAIINLAVALLILIVEQATMTGVLSALGMPQGMLQRVFIYHALLIASVGIVVGNAIGLGICWLQQSTGFLKLEEATYYMSRVPVRLVWWHVVLIDAGTLLVCLLCMWLPVLYIRRIRPAKVLQFK